jgi:WD40-like Beta Propeller Repeat
MVTGRLGDCLRAFQYGHQQIYTVGADGGEVTRVTADSADDRFPAWSPDGSLLAFASDRSGDYEIYAMRLESSGTPTNLTQSPSSDDYAPAWSPDGSELVFTSCCRDGVVNSVYKMNADGSQQTKVTSNSLYEDYSDWGSSVFDPSKYPRPKGASPFRAALVPAYQPCSTTGNRSHGPPLTYPSCAPPAQTSGQLTVGSPDANSQGSNSTGSVTVKAIPGNAVTPTDDADAGITTSITDVRKKPDLSDYVGNVQTVLGLRVTDRESTHSGEEPQTLEDVSFSITVPCDATPSTALGSTCSLTTTADTVMPGVVPESKRSVWALDKVKVYDAGADGDVTTSGDNTLFETQGAFIP